MKAGFVSLTLVASVCFATTLLLNGCASTKMVQSAGPSTTIQGISDDYRQAQLQTAATEDALEQLAITPQPDLRQAYDFFKINLAIMEQVGERLIAHADGMFYRGTYYFVESGKSADACVFPRTGRQQDRLSLDLGEDFGALAETSEEVKRAFRAFQFDIEQIKGYLAHNLNPTGIDTMGQILRKAEVDSESLQEKLQEALAVLEHASTVLKQGPQKKG